MVQYDQEMHVRGTDLMVTIKKGSRLFGLDKLVVTNHEGNLVREIIPFGEGKRIDSIDSVEYNPGRITVGYGAEHAGIVRVYESRGWIPIGNTGRHTAYYNLSTGELIPDFSL